MMDWHAQELRWGLVLDYLEVLAHLRERWSRRAR